jgi:hypothetical protein
LSGEEDESLLKKGTGSERKADFAERGAPPRGACPPFSTLADDLQEESPTNRFYLSSAIAHLHQFCQPKDFNTAI